MRFFQTFNSHADRALLSLAKYAQIMPRGNVMLQTPKPGHQGGNVRRRNTHTQRLNEKRRAPAVTSSNLRAATGAR